MHMHLENSAVWLLPNNCNQKEMITQTHILKAIHLPAEQFLCTNDLGHNA